MKPSTCVVMAITFAAVFWMFKPADAQSCTVNGCSYACEAGEARCTGTTCPGGENSCTGNGFTFCCQPDCCSGTYTYMGCGGLFCYTYPA